MPVLFPTPIPAFDIVRLSHVRLAVRDLAASEAFYVGALGMIVTEREGNTLYLRALEERNHHSLVLVESSHAAVLGVGFKVASDGDLDRLKVRLDAVGLPTQERALPHHRRTLLTSDPHGVPLEFYVEMTSVERRLQRYADYRGCQPQRLDHVNLFTRSVQASHDFWVGELGFRTTEYTETDDGRDPPELWAIWMHRKGNVHDVAFTNGKGPRLHHVAYWVPTAQQIIHLCDVLSTTGYLDTMERGPGRHGISNAFFLYLRDPDGHRVEIYTSDYLTVDPDFEPIRWGLRDPQRQTLWGAPAPASWFEEGSVFDGVSVDEPHLDALPIVAP